MPVISDELTLYKCYFFLILGRLCRYECHYGNLRVWEGVRFLLKIDPRRDGIERHLSVDGFAEGDTETAGRSPEDARRVHQVAEEHTRAPGPRPDLSRRPGHCPVSLRNAKNHNHSGPRNPPRSPLRRFQTADVNVKKEKKKKREKRKNSTAQNCCLCSKTAATSRSCEFSTFAAAFLFLPVTTFQTALFLSRPLLLEAPAC